MFVQVLSYLTLAPSQTIVAHTSGWEFRTLVASQPWIVQFIEVMILTDLAQYWLHRAFHRIPFLWGFHAVHHSAKSMDWIAGARMHFLEIVVLRAFTALPMMTLGFDAGVLQAYIGVVYVYSAFIHANVGWSFAWVEKYLVTPRFHHWHHGIEKEAIDVNFAIHFPWLDRLFGTHHLPAERWPKGYGVGGHPVPRGYLAQFLFPFRRGEN
jgi:sterol desaturase/sphingolipid hydroxylase (fatty acid hydroxylase superfamily)